MFSIIYCEKKKNWLMRQAYQIFAFCFLFTFYTASQSFWNWGRGIRAFCRKQAGIAMEFHTRIYTDTHKQTNVSVCHSRQTWADRPTTVSARQRSLLPSSFWSADMLCPAWLNLCRPLLHRGTHVHKHIYTHLPHTTNKQRAASCSVAILLMGCV